MKTLKGLKHSEVLRLAISDLEKCKIDSDYIINMCVWHYPVHAGKCGVCLAGAVMAKSLERGTNETLEPYDFDNITSGFMLWLNEARIGAFNLGTLPYYERKMEGDLYEKDYDLWKKEMLDYADFLEKEGF